MLSLHEIVFRYRAFNDAYEAKLNLQDDSAQVRLVRQLALQEHMAEQREGRLQQIRQKVMP